MTTKRSVLLIVAVLVIAIIGLHLSIRYRYQHAFNDTANGDSKLAVIQRFGNPSARESKGQGFSAYTDKSCQSPCVERLWWEAPLPVPRGIEAWNVEFDSTDHVVNKAHILFP